MRLVIFGLGPRGLADFDLTLSYTDGAALTELRRELGARHAAPRYGSVDPSLHRPVPATQRYRADLSYLGTYAPDRIFQAAPFIDERDFAIVGLPDTIWFPADALRALREDPLSFLMFPVDAPERFDAVLTGPGGRVQEIRVKQPDPGTRWIWGAFKLAGRTLHQLRALWEARARRDEYCGTLVNAWLAAGGQAIGVAAGETYLDVGTLHGYREAIGALSARAVEATR
jgi:spore maturation protein CgeB